MPANINALTRYKILDELLSDRYHYYTLDDLFLAYVKNFSELCSQVAHDDDVLVVNFVDYDTTKLLKISELCNFFC